MKLREKFIASSNNILESPLEQIQSQCHCNEQFFKFNCSNVSLKLKHVAKNVGRKAIICIVEAHFVLFECILPVATQGVFMMLN